MKKNLFLLAMLMSATILTASASPAAGADPRTEKNFQQQFAGAQNVHWEKVGEGFSKVSFTWGGHRTEAYYDQSGQLAGSIRGLFFEQLPLSVVRAVGSSFRDAVVIEVREITNDEGTNYRLVLEKNNKKFKVRLNSYGALIEKERIRN